MIFNKQQPKNNENNINDINNKNKFIDNNNNINTNNEKIINKQQKNTCSDFNYFNEMDKNEKIINNKNNNISNINNKNKFIDNNNNINTNNEKIINKQKKNTFSDLNYFNETDKNEKIINNNKNNNISNINNKNKFIDNNNNINTNNEKIINKQKKNTFSDFNYFNEMDKNNKQQKNTCSDLNYFNETDKNEKIINNNNKNNNISNINNKNKFIDNNNINTNNEKIINKQKKNTFSDLNYFNETDKNEKIINNNNKNNNISDINNKNKFIDNNNINTNNEKIINKQKKNTFSDLNYFNDLDKNEKQQKNTCSDLNYFNEMDKNEKIINNKNNNISDINNKNKFIDNNNNINTNNEKIINKQQKNTCSDFNYFNETDENEKIINNNNKNNNISNINNKNKFIDNNNNINTNNEKIINKQKKNIYNIERTITNYKFIKNCNNLRLNFELFTIYPQKHQTFYPPFICNEDISHYHCKWCKKTFNANISNFKRHLNSDHYYEFQNYKKNNFIPENVTFEGNNEVIRMYKSSYSAKIFLEMIKAKIELNIPIGKLKKTILVGQKIQSQGVENLVDTPSNTAVFNHLDCFDEVQKILDKIFLKNLVKNEHKLCVISDHSKKFNLNLHSILISYFKVFTESEEIEKKNELNNLIQNFNFDKSNKNLRKKIEKIEKILFYGGEVEIISLGLKNGDNKKVDDIEKNILEKFEEYDLKKENFNSMVCDNQICNPLTANKLKLNFFRCSNHLINIAFQKCLKKLLNVTNFKNNSYFSHLKKLIKIILNNFILCKVTKKISLIYEKNNFEIDLMDFKNIFIDNQNIYEKIIKSFEIENKDENIKKPKNLSNIRFMCNGPIHLFLMKNNFIISEFFWICLSCINENLKEEIEDYKKFFNNKTNIINIYIIGIIYKQLNLIQKKIRKSTIMQMKNLLNESFDILKIENIYLQDEYKQLEKFLNENNLSNEFSKKIKDSISIIIEEFKKLNNVLDNDFFKIASIAGEKGIISAQELYNKYIMLTNEEKTSFDPLKIFSHDQFQLFLKNNENLMVKENNKFKYDKIVNIFQKNYFCIIPSNDPVESSFSFIQKNGEHNMSLKTLERIVIYIFNKIKVDPYNVNHQKIFSLQFNIKNKKSKIEKNKLINCLNSIKRKSKEKVIDLEKKDIEKKILEKIKMIKKEEIQFKITKKNLLLFIKEWKNLEVRTNLKKMSLMEAILIDEENMWNSLILKKKKKFNL
jgi:hypothetical protein